MKTCQSIDYTNCSITEGYSKTLKLYIIILIIILLIVIYQLTVKKYFMFLGFSIIIIILYLIINHQTNIFALPKWKKPKKINTNYNHLLNSNMDIQNNRNL